MRLGQNLLQQGAAGGGGGVTASDVFSTDLYTGTGTNQTITNGIDLSGEGGLVWLKGRSLAYDHALFDTNRGTTFRLKTNGTGTQVIGTSQYMTSFNADGFTIGNEALLNQSGGTYASWTFRQAPKFFDVVTYTGDGTGISRKISHGLNQEPGLIIHKRRDSTDDWRIYHRAIDRPNQESRLLNFDTGAAAAGGPYWDVSSNDFGFFVNTSGADYVAYLFAHDTAADGVIQCGSYTGTSGDNNGPSVSVGWEPQWVMIKQSSGTGDWWIVDNQRGNAAGLRPNLSNAELTASPDLLSFNSTGFTISNGAINAISQTYIYVAIRAEGV